MAFELFKRKLNGNVFQTKINIPFKNKLSPQFIKSPLAEVKNIFQNRLLEKNICTSNVKHNTVSKSSQYKTGDKLKIPTIANEYKTIEYEDFFDDGFFDTCNPYTALNDCQTDQEKWATMNAVDDIALENLLCIAFNDRDVDNDGHCMSHFEDICDQDLSMDESWLRDSGVVLDAGDMDFVLEMPVLKPPGFQIDSPLRQ